MRATHRIYRLSTCSYISLEMSLKTFETMVSCRCFSIQCLSRLIQMLFLYPCYVRSNTLFIKIFKIQINRHYLGRKLYLGWGGMTKKMFFERHYFLRLQQQFPEKWGAHAPKPPPPGSNGTDHSLRLSEPLFVTVCQIWWTLTSLMPFLGRFYQYLHIILPYIMCISSKSQTVFWAQNFRDVQLIPNFLRYPAWLWYCSFWKAMLATNCLMNGFSYSNNIFTKCLWRKTAEWSEIKVRFKIYMVLNSL